MMTDVRRPRVVIVGAGFAGLNAAKALKREKIDVTVIDRTNHHLFQPLLYQVATAALNPAEIASPVRSILRGQHNTTVLLGTVTGVDYAKKVVNLDHGRHAVPYDYLILAMGGRTSYFGHAEWAKWAPGLKTLPDALEIRKRVLFSFERAERETDFETRRKLMTIVIIGGGPTGVELAGAFAELRRHVLVRDFRRIRPEVAHVILIEAADRILLQFPEDLSRSALRQLEACGVEVRTGVTVKNIREGCVETTQGVIEAENIIWAAGVGGHKLGKKAAAEIDRAGRVVVNVDLRIPGQECVYCLGDMALFQHPDIYGGKPLPGVSPVAIQQGRHAAMNIVRQTKGKAPLPFRYSDKGSMATIGRSRAIAVLGRLQISGFPAWLCWLFVHIWYLIDFQNRVVVLIRWAWSYVTWKRGARLITDPPDPQEDASKSSG